MRRAARVIDNVLADRKILRESVDNIIRDFIEHERRHILMEDHDFFPAALKALEPQDWTDIASASTSREDPLFSDAAEKTFDAVRTRILQLEQEAEAERQQAPVPHCGSALIWWRRRAADAIESFSDMNS